MQDVSAANLRATVEKLASYNTRNTLSATMPEAAEWLRSEFAKLPRMKTELMTYVAPKGRRVPEDMEVVQCVATLPGKSDRILVMGGHMDSLNLQVDAKTGRAPGANDDASGVAATLECARLLSQKEHEQTIVFVGFTGEEQGLLGSRALAEKAKAEGWKIDGVLSNDTVGSSSNLAGQKDEKHVRVFSEEGEDHNSRELARFLEWEVRQGGGDFRLKLVLRRDRFGRGGDHTPFVQNGFNAVRFIEVHEEYTRQHTPDDLPEHMDWNYLANVAKCNLIGLTSLANAGPSPSNVRIKMDQGHNTTVTWKSNGAKVHTVYWRDTRSAVWEGHVDVKDAEEATIPLVNKDDHFFAVGAEGGVPTEAR
ncbi:MAG: M20/M25/M40 family metallo-hydrolase [Armatimonadetes bacterium]|nr:M20/M25/M40 family metallo-hydrolase [Armatimonadota bacterium]